MPVTPSTLLRISKGRRGSLPPGLLPIDNSHKVPKHQWAKWTEAQRRRFNQLFELMNDHPHFFVHPKANKVSSHHWQTTAWNAAFMAACTEVTP